MGGNYAAQMLFLGLKCKALEHEEISDEQRRRLETELLPAVRTIAANQQRENKRGLLAIQIQKATSIFADIFGDDWHPRDDNPVQRECIDELQTRL
ncbi:hypothetical protein SEA_GUDMIT_73 [Gordonia phage Gudmit]|nr:hypothetical protein SEA_GUDMIT_73 [Gordonia phage Gudmit]